jgi:predicted Zn-dependent peptidase
VVASQQWLADWNEQLLAVRSEDVQRVAQCYLQPERQTVGYYVPLTEETQPA